MKNATIIPLPSHSVPSVQTFQVAKWFRWRIISRGVHMPKLGDVLQFRYNPASKSLSIRCKERYRDRVITLRSSTPKEEAYIAIRLISPNDAVDLIHDTVLW